MIQTLKEDVGLQAAARIASRFRQDPVAMLSDGGDPFLFAVREAAALVISDDEKRQAEESERKARSSRSGRRASRRR